MNRKSCETCLVRYDNDQQIDLTLTVCDSLVMFWVTSERTPNGLIFPMASVIMSINLAMTSIGCFFPARAIRDLLMVLGDLFYFY